MKLTKSRLKQIIKEELSEASSFHIAGEDKATHLANKATYAVVQAIAEDPEISEEDAAELAGHIRSAVKDIIKNYLKPDVAEI